MHELRTRLADRRTDARDRGEDGFTLIELMVVILIIAILIAIAIPTFLGARQKAQDRAAQSNLRNAPDRGQDRVRRLAELRVRHRGHRVRLDRALAHVVLQRGLDRTGSHLGGTRGHQ